MASPVSTSSRGFASAVLEVAAELVVEPLQRIVGQRLAFERADRRRRADRRAKLLPEHLVVLLRDAEQVRDHQHRERLGVFGEELTLAVGDELVELRRRRGAT